MMNFFFIPTVAENFDEIEFVKEIFPDNRSYQDINVGIGTDVGGGKNKRYKWEIVRLIDNGDNRSVFETYDVMGKSLNL